MAKLLETPVRPGIDLFIKCKRQDKAGGSRVFYFNCTLEKYEGGVWTAACKELGFVTETESKSRFGDALYALTTAIIQSVEVSISEGLEIRSARPLVRRKKMQGWTSPHGSYQNWEYSFV